MTMTAEELKRSIQMYGCNIETYMESVKASPTFKLSGTAMVVGSILSDVQEMIAHGGMEEIARQHLNIAKYIIFNSAMTLNENLE